MDKDHPDYWKFEEIQLFKYNIMVGHITPYLGTDIAERSGLNNQLLKFADEILNMQEMYQAGMGDYPNMIEDISTIYDTLFKYRMAGRLIGKLHDITLEEENIQLKTKLDSVQKKCDKKHEENVALLEELSDKNDLIEEYEKQVRGSKD